MVEGDKYSDEDKKNDSDEDSSSDSSDSSVERKRRKKKVYFVSYFPVRITVSLLLLVVVSYVG